MRLINSKIIKFVPIKEMTSVLSVENKAIDRYKDKWVRIKNGIYKGDLGKVSIAVYYSHYILKGFFTFFILLFQLIL